jgi:formamidopyrimidine-DNA glycosylase
MRDVYSHLTFMENGGDKKVLAELEGEVKDEKVEVKKETIQSSTEKVKMATEAMEVKDEKVMEELWPPKFVKLSMTLRKNDSTIELVFVDPRRLARIRLLTGNNIQTDEELMNQPPLDVLGPDYSKPITVPKEIGMYGDPDPDNHGRPILSIDEFNKLVLTKKKPLKSLLLEQKFFCGIGNWVADEIIYHSRLHPEDVLSSKLTLQEEIDPVIQKLYDSIIYVCKEAVRVEGNVREFPDDWLMMFRWGKGRKGPRPKTKDGYDVDYVTVGGRTSCFVPKLQVPLKRSNNSETSAKKRIKRE